MEELKIVELGDVSGETRGTMFIGLADPGGVHFYYFPHVLSEHSEGVFGRALRKAFKHVSHHTLS